MDKRIQRAWWKRPVVFLPIAILLFIAFRGVLISSLVGGLYSWESFFVDSIAAIIILGSLQLLDTVVVSLLNRTVGTKTAKRQFCLKAIRSCVVLLISGTLLLATAQLHPPKIGCSKTPGDSGLDWAAHTIQTDDGLELSAWTIPTQVANRPVVVLTHGLGANKQNFLHIARLIHKLDYNIVMFDFRAHGDSAGRTCTLGVHEGLDVKAAHDFAKNHYPDHPVYCWSTSMGGAAALRATANHEIFEKLVVDATFTSIKNVAMETKFSYLGPFATPAWQLSRMWYMAYVGDDIDQFGPLQDIAEIKGKPILLIHGTNDQIIPHTESEKLQHAAEPGTELWLVRGAAHCGSFHHPDYGQKLTEFFDGPTLVASSSTTAAESLLVSTAATKSMNVEKQDITLKSLAD